MQGRERKPAKETGSSPARLLSSPSLSSPRSAGGSVIFPSKRDDGNLQCQVVQGPWHLLEAMPRGCNVHEVTLPAFPGIETGDRG